MILSINGRADNVVHLKCMKVPQSRSDKKIISDVWPKVIEEDRHGNSFNDENGIL